MKALRPLPSASGSILRCSQATPSHERSDIAGAESFHSLEGHMCGTVMRGADALPGSKATSRAKGSHRKLGDLGSGHRCRVGAEYDGPHREDEESKPMMHGHEKSDLAIVAGKSANNVAPRCGAIRGGVSRSGVDGAKGGDQGECEPAKHVPGAEPDKRVTGAGSHAATTCRLDPRWEPYAGKPHVRFCAGGAR